MDNELEEYINDLPKIELDNQSRNYFGLNNVDESWDKVNINEKITLFYEGNIIKKIIHKELFLSGCKFISYKYVEHDTNLETNDRKTILPKTNRGREKKITPTSLFGFMPTGCNFTLIIDNRDAKTYIFAYNPKNNIQLPVTNYEWIRTYDDFKKFIDEYIKTCKSDYFEKVDRMRNLPHQTIKFGVGDIFRIELDRENYGYGLIIGKTRDLEKWEEMPKEHPFHHLMTQPILVRIYKIKTKDKNLKAKDLEKYKLSYTRLYCDGDIYWGKHTIVDNKILNEDDIEFPIHYKRVGSMCFQLTWGFALIKVSVIEIPKELDDIRYNSKFNQIGTKIGIQIDDFERILNSESEYLDIGDIRNSQYSKIKEEVFKLFNVDNNISFDEFNKKYNGLTRKQYIDKLYKKHEN